MATILGEHSLLQFNFLSGKDDRKARQILTYKGKFYISSLSSSGSSPFTLTPLSSARDSH